MTREENDIELQPLPSDEETLSSESEGDELVHFRWRVAKDLTRRLDQYLVDRVGYLSRNAVQNLIREGLVTVNGKPTKPAYRPCRNDIVEMAAPPEPVNELVPEPIPLDIVYEDEYFLALNKPADLIVHPARGRWTGTLVNGLVYYGRKWSTINGEWRPGILHRLDRNTTGIMLVAKADEAHWRLARQFENRTIQKTYLALVHGEPELRADEIDLPIGKDRYHREKQAVRKIEHGGKTAITRYEVQESFEVPSRLKFYNKEETVPDQPVPAVPQGRCTLVKLWPKTGRTHQLRVHMAAIGHPIVGDTVYHGRCVVEWTELQPAAESAGQPLLHVPRSSGSEGIPAGAVPRLRIERQMLHAYEIAFTHPVTLQPMTLTAPLPRDFARLLEILRSQGNPLTDQTL
ncbi:MAG: RluA family pseudouridine synthase [Phycisphaerae bacterium]|nr:RluA family pseudouridine synthase [Phycisphaerae bacterium]MDW8261511.1 RluA family pseudouridine synthase [Phycisphaerales bacterium]